MKSQHNSEKKHHLHTAGFTLVELLVAFFIFALIVGATINLAVSGIAGQRQALATQEVIDETSFVAEYMSRAVREADKDIVPNCVATKGLNYELFDDNADGKDERVRFLDRDGLCREFLFETNQIKEKISTNDEAANLGAAEPLVSDDVTVTDLIFQELGASQTDTEQPRLTFFIALKAGEQPIRLQTTVSQRKFDVPE